MNKHYHMLLRCLEANFSGAVRWPQVSHASAQRDSSSLRP